MISIDSAACRIEWCFESEDNGVRNIYQGCIRYRELCPGLVQVWDDNNTTTSTVNVVGEGYADNAAFIAELDSYNDVCCGAGGTVEPVEPPEPVKCLVGVHWAVDPEDKKKRIPVYLWKNPNCWTDDIEGNNIINIKEYDMSNFAGLPPTFEEKTVEKTFEICGETATLQDILDTAIAAGVTIDGTPVDGIIGLEIVAEYKGQVCNGETTTGQGVTYGAEPNIISLDGGQKFCEKLNYLDEDCDGLADACYDLTTPYITPAGHGAIVNAIFALCDDDPTTPATREKEG